jgi:hypothetical protein
VKFRALIFVLAFAAALAGCSSNNNNEWQPLVCSVQSINDGGAVISAALNTGSDPAQPNDDYVPLDYCTVEFWARAGNTSSVIPDDRAYSAFIITAYDATWRPEGAAPAELTDYNIVRAPLSVRVPIDDANIAYIAFAPAAMKTEVWYPDPTLGGPVFGCPLDFVFYGHAEGSEHEVAIPAGTYVTFLPTIGTNN